MKNLLLILSVVFFLTACNCETNEISTLVQTTPEEAGFSANRLAMADSLIQNYMQEEWLPGGVFLVAHKGKIAYYKNFGYRSTSKDSLYQKDDIFRIASMSKAITTVGIMQLYEQGKLQLDDPVFKFIPAFKNSAVLDSFNLKDSSYTTIPAKKPITIRQLLTHTSGIIYGDFSNGNMRAVYAKHDMLGVGLSRDTWTTEEFINRLAKVPLAFQPGDRFHYGLNVDVLGRVIEVISGKGLAEYFSEHIFNPLGMKDTYFYLPQEKQYRLIPVYSQDEKGLKMPEGDQSSYFEYPKNEDAGYYAGGGGLSSTAMDYAIFIATLANNGKMNGYQLLGRKTIELMTTDQLTVQNKNGKGISHIPGNTFCLGFGLLTDEAAGLNSKSPGTYEWGGYFSTKFFIDPEEELIFVGMTQVLPFIHGEFYDQLTSIIYGAIE
ncbi:serine hydrolase domain-containing protein [Sunxiuqinia sp. A32]|uniref:serine hydrolase domain-containing protein n=1 Tax=Sunxiuqinia sp. A32 TaxID=3461496 RepID=UPI0040467300